ncbi:MAG: cation-transporting P-type ATPase, partial [Clostridia bacterium]|nr:cation-transporting P-type ATPase [Clostridia bacterium]
YAKSIIAVVLSQFTNLYTAAFIVMGIITALCDFKGSMAAWIIFFAVAVVNMVSGFLRDYADRQIAVKFDERRTDEVKIIRDGVKTSTDPTLLVKGDIILLEEGDIVPADIRILECDNLKADESIFKGRNVPVDKVSEKSEDEVDAAECANILYCGSTIASGNAVGAVIATGKDTVLARVNANKSRKLDMHDKFGKNAQSEKILVCVALVVASIVLTVTALKTKSFPLAMLQSCTVAMCLLPAPVCIVRALGIFVCSQRLKKSAVSMEQDDFVYDIGMSEYFLFDKGGLITNSDTVLEERVVSDESKLEMAVICSDCEFIAGSLVGNETDKATVTALMNEGVDVAKILDENEKILYMPYDETRMLMATLTKKGDGYILIVKGSVEAIPTLCLHLADGDNVVEMTGEILHRLEQVSSSMAEKGLKVRAVAYKEIGYIPEKLETELNQLTFVGVLGYREALARRAKESVKKIEKVYVKPVMVTGDNIITAAAFARGAGIIKKESECISFHELTDCTDEMLMEAAEKYKVFASATLKDRERLVRVLSEHGKNVVVAGEQMTSPSVALYANVAFGDEAMPDCDIIVPKSDIENIAEVIYKSRTTRANLAYASLLAISLGFAEMLVMMFMLLTGAAELPSANVMLSLNMFVVLVPCLAISTLASVHHRAGEDRLFAVKCVLQGMICALFCLVNIEGILPFMAVYAVLEAARLCAGFNNLEKGRFGIAAVAAMAVALVGVIIALKASVGVVVCALVAVALNGALGYINLKGLKR